MTTPPSTVSLLGLVTALVLGILLLLGAFEVPIPTVDTAARSGQDMVDRAWTGEIEESVRALEASLLAQGEALARQEATSQRLAELEAQLRRLEAGQLEATQRAERAQALAEEMARVRREAAARPGDRVGTVVASSAWAGTITGVVTDAGTDRPLESVQVFLRGTGIGGLTDADGRFLLLHVPGGVHEVVAQRIGFAEGTRNVSVATGVRAQADFELREAAIELSTLLVTGEPAVPSGALSSTESPLVYIDDVRVAGPRPHSLTDLISPDEVDRIEIIKPPAAVELYGEAARSGVVRIYRKRSERPATPPPPPAPDGMTFTPFTVQPSIRNADEVRAAMREAYPTELRAEGIGGTVEVYFFISEEGVVQDFRINRSSGHQALDDAALRVAGVYRFSPALNRDERVAVWVAFPITFLPSD